MLWGAAGTPRPLGQMTGLVFLVFWDSLKWVSAGTLPPSPLGPVDRDTPIEDLE